MPAISRVSSAKGNGKGPVGGAPVESLPVVAVSDLQASLTPCSVVGRLVFVSGVAKTYPAMRVTILQKS